MDPASINVILLRRLAREGLSDIQERGSMQNAAWMALWRRLPPEQHDQLMVVTAIGTEIAIQNILRIEEDFVVIRGRLAGSSDVGRVFFVPYNQINYAGFQRAVKEDEFEALFGGSEPQAAVEAAVREPASQPAGTKTPLPPSKSAASQGSALTANDRPRHTNRPPLPLKSELLERLRSRSHQGAGQRPAEES